MGIVPDEFRNFRCVSNQSSSGRGIYIYIYNRDPSLGFCALRFLLNISLQISE